MRRIYKYPVRPGAFELEMPMNAQPLRCMVQGVGGQPQLWALVDPSESTERRRFVVYGTGHDIPEENIRHLTFVDTFMLENGDLVFHLFAVDRGAVLRSGEEK